MLEEALETLARHLGKPDARSRKLVQDVLAWFETRGDSKSYFTCDHVCLALGLNAGCFRREMRRALRQGIDLTPILRERRQALINELNHLRDHYRQATGRIPQT